MVVALVAAGVAVVLIAVIAIVLVNRQRSTDVDPPPATPTAAHTAPSSQGPSAPSSSETGPTASETSPTAPASPSQSWTAPSGAPSSVVDNPIYRAQMGPWECAGLEPAVPDDGTEMQTWLEDTIIDCMMDRYRPAVEAAGAELTTPQVIWFDRQIETPCGVTRQPDAPPYYCSGDEAIYVNADTVRTYTDTARLAALSLLFHEFAHHVQHRVGILNQAYDPPFNGEDRQQISRRMELQAECFSWIQVQTLTTTGWSESDDREFRNWLEGPKDDEHGSNASYRFWYERASGETSFESCNTFIAPDDKVS